MNFSYFLLFLFAQKATERRLPFGLARPKARTRKAVNGGLLLKISFVLAHYIVFELKGQQSACLPLTAFRVRATKSGRPKGSARKFATIFLIPPKMTLLKCRFAVLSNYGCDFTFKSRGRSRLCNMNAALTCKIAHSPCLYSVDVQLTPKPENGGKVSKEISVQIGSYRLRDKITKAFLPCRPIMKNLTQKVAEKFYDSVANILADCYTESENRLVLLLLLLFTFLSTACPCPTQ